LVREKEGTAMKRMRTTVVPVVSATVWLLLGCNDQQDGRMPTDPALDARDVQASFSRDGDDDNDGGGSKFRLFGSARMTEDPENPDNVVLEIVTPISGDVNSTGNGAIRELKHVKIWELDHMLTFHRAFVAPHSCATGSPRVILLIDSDGDGDRDFTANGHVRPPYTGCETSNPTPSSGGASPSTLLWRFEDVTDEQQRWEITPGGRVPGIPTFPFVTWDALETAVSNAFPDHRVLAGGIVEDFNTSPPGKTLYDLVTIYDLTLGTRGQEHAKRRGRDDDRH
jgi:hypothetical protein